MCLFSQFNCLLKLFGSLCSFLLPSFPHHPPAPPRLSSTTCPASRGGKIAFSAVSVTDLNTPALSNNSFRSAQIEMKRKNKAGKQTRKETLLICLGGRRRCDCGTEWDGLSGTVTWKFCHLQCCSSPQSATLSCPHALMTISSPEPAGRVWLSLIHLCKAI